MRVLLLAHAFPPFNSSGAIRAAKLAEHLLTRGHDVRVITGVPHPYPVTLSTTFPNERVIATAWVRIEAPLDVLRKRITGNARSLNRAAGASRNASAIPDPGRRSLLTTAVVAYRSLLSFPDAQAGWIAKATAAGRRLFATWQPELIYSTALPFSSHVVAARLAKAARCAWVGEYRDLFSGNAYKELWRARDHIDRWFERRIMSTAAAAVAVSPPLTDYLAQLHGKPSATVMNGFDPADFSRAPDLSGEVDPAKVTIVYTGIVYPGKRDPSILFEALSRLGAERSRFEVRFYGQSLETVIETARRHGVDDVVQTFAPVPYLTSLGLQKAADILLLLLWDSPLEKGVLTGKLFEYAGAGRPVLSLGCADGAAAAIIEDHKLGLATNAVDAVERFLIEIAERKARGYMADQPDVSRAGAGLSRREQFAALECFLADCGLLQAPVAAG